MAELRIDELNVLRSLPYEEYFGPMYLTDTQKRYRIDMAEAFEVEFLYVLSEIDVLRRYSVLNWARVQRDFERAYMNVLEGLNEPVTDDIRDYVRDMSRDLTRSTRDHLEDEYTLSYDRARLISENEAGTISNYQEFNRAVAEGKTRKTWHTMEDQRVRDAHVPMDGVTIPINDLFSVGDGLMLVPRDETYGASPDLTVNCRCSCTYS